MIMEVIIELYSAGLDNGIHMYSSFQFLLAMPIRRLANQNYKKTAFPDLIEIKTMHVFFLPLT